MKLATRDRIRLGIWLAHHDRPRDRRLRQGAQHAEAATGSRSSTGPCRRARCPSVVLLVPRAPPRPAATAELLALRRPTRIGRTALIGSPRSSARPAQRADGPLRQPREGAGHRADPLDPRPHARRSSRASLAVAVLVPITEETFFRGAGLGLLLRESTGPPEAIVVCGCLFALVHGLVLGFLPLAFLGADARADALDEREPLPGILLHGTYNALAVVSSLHCLREPPPSARDRAPRSRSPARRPAAARPRRLRHRHAARRAGAARGRVLDRVPRGEPTTGTSATASSADTQTASHTFAGRHVRPSR